MRGRRAYNIINNTILPPLNKKFKGSPAQNYIKFNILINFYLLHKM